MTVFEVSYVKMARPWYASNIPWFLLAVLGAPVIGMWIIWWRSDSVWTIIAPIALSLALVKVLKDHLCLLKRLDQRPDSGPHPPPSASPHPSRPKSPPPCLSAGAVRTRDYA